TRVGGYVPASWCGGSYNFLCGGQWRDDARCRLFGRHVAIPVDARVDLRNVCGGGAQRLPSTSRPARAAALPTDVAYGLGTFAAGTYRVRRIPAPPVRATVRCAPCRHLISSSPSRERPRPVPFRPRMHPVYC